MHDSTKTTRRELLLKVNLPGNLDYHTVFDDVFYQHLRDSSLLSVETIRDDVIELVYSIELKRAADESRFLEALRGIAQGGKVALLVGQQQINV